MERYVPTTPIDRIVHEGNIQEVEQPQEAPIIKGIKMVDLTIPEADAAVIARVFGYREEFHESLEGDSLINAHVDLGELLERTVCPIQTSDGLLTELHVNTIGRDSWHEMILRLANSAAAQEELLKRSRSVEIGIGNTYDLRLDYDPSDHEGLGAVYFWGRRKGESEYLPLFNVGGTPRTRDGQPCFQIRVIQTWISSRTDITEFSRTEEEDPFEPAIVEAAKPVLQTIAQLRDGIKNELRKGSAENQKVSEEDIYLLMAVAYLRGIGIEFFEGIDHIDQPYASKQKSKDQHQARFDYDELFERWFEERETLIYPWFLNAKGTGAFIQNEDNIPPAVGVAINTIFQDLQHE